jgi:hypothetical protein
MATSPNYGWSEPDNTSLVKNGAQAMRTLGDAIDTSVWNIGYGQAGKNKIINGDFGIWQRGTSFTTNGAYTADRFYGIYDGTGTKTISQQSFTAGTAPVSGYEAQYFARFNQTVAGTGGTYNVFSQKIEDVRTFAGQTATLSFWAKAGSAISMASTPLLIQGFGSGGSGNVNNGPISGSAPSLTTSWQRFTFTYNVASIAGKTIGTGSSLNLEFYMPLNTTFSIDIWGVQVEYGSKATPFETASGSIQGELSACMRYFQVIGGNIVTENIGTGQVISTTEAIINLDWKVPFRVAPTIAFGTGGAATDFQIYNAAATALSLTSILATVAISANSARTIPVVASGLVAGNATIMVSANSNGRFFVSAEL